MLKPMADGVNVFRPSFKLDERQLGIIASSVRQEWWDIMQRLMESEIALMNIKLVNSDDEKEVLVAHRLVRGAAMFYEGIMQRIAEITTIDAYNQSGIGSAENPEIPTYMEEFTALPTDAD
jgi:hypothetical protein